MCIRDRMYPHVVYTAANKELDGDEEQGIEEGVAILSKHPIIDWHVLELGSSEDAIDPSRRVVLHATVQLPAGTTIQVLNAHFSWADWQQCDSVRVLKEYVATLSMQACVLLGDLNVYFGYDWPLDSLLHDSATVAALASIPSNPCSQAQQLGLSSNTPRFADSLGLLGKSSQPTFSNVDEFNSLDNDNPASQPDKVLVAGPLVVIAGSTFGLQEAAGAVEPSDHLGVWITLGVSKDGAKWQQDGTLRLAAQELRKQSTRIVKNHAVFGKHSAEAGGRMNTTTMGKILKASRIPEMFAKFDVDNDDKISWTEIFPFLFPKLSKLLPLE
eukprot:TRINITY_DN18323_c0_g1_i2.p1 TRINITY_DN18323_c0_g1~~TRINITY_DN18323_c0_g1_i2.p1  ORF type:complete len:328 (-),score=76.56 TRINITY_DN18323_c0_g1_i2:21-1004(-)